MVAFMAATKKDTITIDKEFKARMKIFKEALKSEEKKVEFTTVYMDLRSS